MATLPPDQLFLEILPLIEKLIDYACRRAHLSGEEAKDFASWVKLKLIEDDYGVFRQFQERCTLKTYLATVINRLMLDHLNRIWGKWRPSAEAERLGKVAIRLERLLVRDEYTFDQACQILRTNEKVELSVVELDALRVQLPHRTGRHPVDEKDLEGEVDRGPTPYQDLQEKEREGLRRRVCAALYRALATLPAEDRLLIQMNAKFKVAEIARIRHVEQKPLYRRLEKIYKALEKALDREGVRREDVEEILGGLQPDLFARPKKTG